MIELGDLVRDVVTGFEGVVVARTEWMYGCVRLTLQAKALHDGKPVETCTFDEPGCALVERGTAHVPWTRPAGGREGPTRREDPR